MDDLARHRATLGLARDARPTHGEVKAAFKRAARAAHPDAAGCAVKFREVVAARDARLGRGRSRDAAYARGGAAAAAAARGGVGRAADAGVRGGAGDAVLRRGDGVDDAAEIERERRERGDRTGARMDKRAGERVVEGGSTRAGRWESGKVLEDGSRQREVTRSAPTPRRVL